MRTALDTNIVAGLLKNTSKTADILTHIGICKLQGSILIGPAVFAESLANPRLPPGLLKDFLIDSGILVDFNANETIWTMAGERYARYAARRRNSTVDSPRRIIADFLIGAHPLAYADRLMTYDTKIYRQDFPELTLYPLPGL